MLFPLDTAPSSAHALSALMSTTIALRAVGDELAQLAADAGAAAAAADWSSPAARRFHERAGDLRDALTGASRRASDVVDAAVAARTRLIASSGSALAP
jgi:hypothetical protein